MMATVFDNIVTKENDHTQLLRALMERHSGVACAVLSHLMGQNFTEELSATLTFAAQSSFVSEFGREIPDLVVTGSGIHCLIEAKVDPSLELTEAQRRGYKHCFPQAEGCYKYLCLLVPDEWKHWASFQEVQDALPSEIKCRITSWRQLIKALEAASMASSDPLLLEALRFWKTRFEVEPMTTEERQVLQSWSESLYAAVTKLEKSVTQAKALFEARNWQTELETDTQSFGFYLKQANAYLLWVGIWTKAPSPLCIGVNARKGGWIRPRDFADAPAKTPDLIWHLWPLDSTAWDDAQRIYDDVTAYVETQYAAGQRALP
jgi:hypothetical protein